MAEQKQKMAASPMTTALAKTMPTGIKIISVLYYIGAVLSLLFGILLLIGAGAISTLVTEIPLLGFLGAGFLTVIAIIMIALAVLGFFIGRGLWKGQNWARIVAIIFAILGFISAIINLISAQWGSIISLVINGLIGYYLLFSKNVKEAFA
ncbi:MAG: hypothetical protein ACFFDT_39640 [Candidatus Hodarchaeota archaeon]